MGNLHVGDLAPDFEARTAEDKTIRLSSFRGLKNVVLFFYPKDFTPGCTAEACSFRDAYDDLQSRDTEVVGVSLDSSDSHARFAQHYALRFPLLSDPQGEIARTYGALGPLGSVLGLAKRMTFVIDRKGVVRAIVHKELQVSRHLKEVRRVLAELQAE